MFTPVLILLIIGLQLDKRVGHRPLWSLGGVVLGFVIAMWLVARQYRSVAQKHSSSHPTEPKGTKI